MVSKQDIPHLLSLIDDDSEEIRDNVCQALLEFGPELEQEILTYTPRLSTEQHLILDNLYHVIRKQKFEEMWNKWFAIEDEKKALEYALSCLAYLEYGYSKAPLRDVLNEIAQRFMTSRHPHNVDGLMQFLFLDEGFKAPAGDFYNPLNSNLTYVIENNQGIQISLACIAILVGKRCDLNIFGLNIPSHFMIISFDDALVPSIYDPFSQGKALPTETIKRWRNSVKLNNIHIDRLCAKTYEIILRVLKNIINAHAKNENEVQREFYHTLFEDLVFRIKEMQRVSPLK